MDAARFFLLLAICSVAAADVYAADELTSPAGPAVRDQERERQIAALERQANAAFAESDFAE